MTDEARAARGHRAFSELKELSAVFDKVEQAFVAKLAATPITHPDVVLRIHAGIQALHAVKTTMQSVVDDGLMAETAIEATGLTRPY